MTPTHRKDDSGIHDHSEEREWTGPSRSDWDKLMGKIEQTANDVCDIQRALWGVRRDGINDDGGVIGEVRKLRGIRKIAWSAVGTAMLSLAGWVWNKFIGGGP